MTNLDQGGRRRALTQVFAAPSALSGVVERLWVDEWPRRSSYEHWRVVADDAPHIIWHISNEDGRHAPRVNVVGARTAHLDVDVSNRRATIGARLRPGALRLLFDAPAFAFTDRSVPLDRLVNGDLARALRALRLVDFDLAVEQLTELIARIAARKISVDDRALWLADRDPIACTRVDDIARQLGMRDRSLRAWSAAHLGISVKAFLKIRRLHGALAMRLASKAATWSQISAATGYADQPHLIRDCRALLGESPGAFMARAG